MVKESLIRLGAIVVIQNNQWHPNGEIGVVIERRLHPMNVDGIEIEGYLTSDDPGFLRQKARELPMHGTYLEIGSWMGLSAIIFAKELQKVGNVDAVVHCVDTWKGSEEHQHLDIVKNDSLYAKFVENIRKSGTADMIRDFRMPSPDMARNWPGPNLDMIFIDGDHTFKGCYEDIMLWHQWLKPGGVMFGHDAAEGSPVKLAAKQAALDLKKEITFFDPPTAHYMWQLL